MGLSSSASCSHRNAQSESSPLTYCIFGSNLSQVTATSRCQSCWDGWCGAACKVLGLVWTLRILGQWKFKGLQIFRLGRLGRFRFQLLQLISRFPAPSRLILQKSAEGASRLWVFGFIQALHDGTYFWVRFASYALVKCSLVVE